ncbi:hypothetical protein ACFL6U_30020 [Planctomycetota bacterium]
MKRVIQNSIASCQQWQSYALVRIFSIAGFFFAIPLQAQQFAQIPIPFSNVVAADVLGCEVMLIIFTGQGLFFQDSYNYLMADNIRKFKGILPLKRAMSPVAYVCNLDVQSDQKTSLSTWQAGQWTQVGQVDYRHAGRELELELALPMAKLKLNALIALSLDFQWADHIQKLGDISEFFLNGDVAPDRGFNYRYETVFSPAKLKTPSTHTRSTP